MKIKNEIYYTLFHALVSYKVQTEIEKENKHKGTNKTFKNIELAHAWLKQFKRKDFKLKYGEINN